MEDKTETLSIPGELAGRGRETFVLRVRGKSMIDDHIDDGDFVVIRKQDTAENGERVVAMIDSEVTRKRYFREKDALRNLTVRVFQKDRSWTILGEEGDLDQKTKNVEVRRNVVITSSDGLRMDTSVIRWDADAQRMWTDEPVTLSRDGSVIQGTAFDMTTDDENATVAGRVRATFANSSAR